MRSSRLMLVNPMRSSLLNRSLSMTLMTSLLSRGNVITDSYALNEKRQKKHLRHTQTHTRGRFLRCQILVPLNHYSPTKYWIQGIIFLTFGQLYLSFSKLNFKIRIRLKHPITWTTLTTTTTKRDCLLLRVIVSATHLFIQIFRFQMTSPDEIRS